MNKKSCLPWDWGTSAAYCLPWSPAVDQGIRPSFQAISIPAVAPKTRIYLSKIQRTSAGLYLIEGVVMDQLKIPSPGEKKLLRTTESKTTTNVPWDGRGVKQKEGIQVTTINLTGVSHLSVFHNKECAPTSGAGSFHWLFLCLECSSPRHPHISVPSFPQDCAQMLPLQRDLSSPCRIKQLPLLLSVLLTLLYFLSDTVTT